jgi:hypothetical protein
MARKVRKLRHWKQRWNKNAAFVWRKRIKYAGELTEPGSPIPEDLQKAPTKLRRFWESQTIELAEFEEPDVATGQPHQAKAAEPAKAETEGEPVEGLEGVTVESLKGSWVLVRTPGEPAGIKVNGQKKLEELLAELRLEASDEDEGDGEGDGEDASEEDADGDAEQAAEDADGSDDEAGDAPDGEAAGDADGSEGEWSEEEDFLS